MALPPSDSNYQTSLPHFREMVEKIISVHYESGSSIIENCIRELKSEVPPKFVLQLLRLAEFGTRILQAGILATSL
jgi:hypothetical protein